MIISNISLFCSSIFFIIFKNPLKEFTSLILKPLLLSSSSSSSSSSLYSYFNLFLLRNNYYNNKKYKYIALDLDGTTLNSLHSLTSKTIETLKYYNNKGIKFIIATGRTSISVYNILNELNLYDEIIPVVCFNGSCVVEISSEYGIKSIIYESPLEYTSTDKLLQFSLKLGLCAQYYIGETGAIYACPKNKIHKTLLEKYAKFTGKKQIYGTDYEIAKSISKPAKILLLVEESEIDYVLTLAKEEFKDEFHIIRGSPIPFFIEFLSPQTNKGNGLKQLCLKRNIPLDSVVSFGDGDNDEEFLRYAGLGIAMKNAQPIAKSAANMVLEWTNDEDGVARQLERMERQGLLDL